MQLRRHLLVCLGLTLTGIGAAYAQAPAQQSAPSLTVDRDPSPSIDPDNVPLATTPGTAGPAVKGQVSKDETGRYTLQAEAYEIQLHVTVLDSSGRVANNLKRDNFHVFEDGVPQSVSSFKHEDLPVSIGLLIDSSASMWDKRAAVEHAALELVRLSNPKDEEFLVDFSNKAYIDQDLTTSVDKLQSGLRYVKTEGNTAAFDALTLSAAYLNKHAKNSKQVILLITDGSDNASRTSLADTIRKVQGLEGPVVYTIGLLFGDDIEKADARRARATLSQLADQTGGVAFFPKSLKDVDKIAAIVAEDIRTQYTIGYHSTNPPSNGGYRAVHVDAIDVDGTKLNARTRNGYMAKGLPVADNAKTPAAPTTTTTAPAPTAKP